MKELGDFDESEKKTIMEKVEADYELECQKAKKRYGPII